ncbi:MAG: tRNA1(Val) (adenine(37)-N6)-methyltransferase [Peptostreptococcales bacterium]
MKNDLKENERIEEIGFGGLKLIQNPDGFCYGIDAVILAKFCTIKKGDIVVDLGTGTGIIPIILSCTEAEKIWGIEIQKEVAEMAQRSIELNGLQDRIHIVNMDMKNISDQFQKNSADVVVSNPPYVKYGSGLIGQQSIKTRSRHETDISLEEVIQTACYLLKEKGDFYLVHRPYRLVDILWHCRQFRLEPKTIRFVYPKAGREPNIVLLHCVKYGNPELKFMPPLYVYQDDGDYTKDIYKIYEKK